MTYLVNGLALVWVLVFALSNFSTIIVTGLEGSENEFGSVSVYQDGRVQSGRNGDSQLQQQQQQQQETDKNVPNHAEDRKDYERFATSDVPFLPLKDESLLRYSQLLFPASWEPGKYPEANNDTTKGSKNEFIPLAMSSEKEKCFSCTEQEKVDGIFGRGEKSAGSPDSQVIASFPLQLSQQKQSQSSGSGRSYGSSAKDVDGQQKTADAYRFKTFPRSKEVLSDVYRNAAYEHDGHPDHHHHHHHYYHYRRAQFPTGGKTHDQNSLEKFNVKTVPSIIDYDGDLSESKKVVYKTPTKTVLDNFSQEKAYEGDKARPRLKIGKTVSMTSDKSNQIVKYLKDPGRGPGPYPAGPLSPTGNPGKAFQTYLDDAFPPSLGYIFRKAYPELSSTQMSSASVGNKPNSTKLYASRETFRRNPAAKGNALGPPAGQFLGSLTEFRSSPDVLKSLKSNGAHLKKSKDVSQLYKAKNFHDSFHSNFGPVTFEKDWRSGSGSRGSILHSKTIPPTIGFINSLTTAHFGKSHPTRSLDEPKATLTEPLDSIQAVNYLRAKSKNPDRYSKPVTFSGDNDEPFKPSNFTATWYGLHRSFSEGDGNKNDSTVRRRQRRHDGSEYHDDVPPSHSYRFEKNKKIIENGMGPRDESKLLNEEAATVKNDRKGLKKIFIKIRDPFDIVEDLHSSNFKSEDEGGLSPSAVIVGKPADASNRQFNYGMKNVENFYAFPHFTDAMKNSVNCNINQNDGISERIDSSNHFHDSIGPLKSPLNEGSVSSDIQNDSLRGGKREFEFNNVSDETEDSAHPSESTKPPRMHDTVLKMVIVSDNGIIHGSENNHRFVRDLSDEDKTNFLKERVKRQIGSGKTGNDGPPSENPSDVYTFQKKPLTRLRGLDFLTRYQKAKSKAGKTSSDFWKVSTSEGQSGKLERKEVQKGKVQVSERTTQKPKLLKNLDKQTTRGVSTSTTVRTVIVADKLREKIQNANRFVLVPKIDHKQADLKEPSLPPKTTTTSTETPTTQPPSPPTTATPVSPKTTTDTAEINRLTTEIPESDNISLEHWHSRYRTIDRNSQGQFKFDETTEEKLEDDEDVVPVTPEVTTEGPTLYYIVNARTGRGKWISYPAEREKLRQNSKKNLKVGKNKVTTVKRKKSETS